MVDLTPIAKYRAPDFTNEHEIGVGDGPHTTDGKTTQISDVVIKAGGQDRDRPTEASNSSLGQLRAKLTSLQDNINIFLTERMKYAKEQDSKDIERRILDDGVDEDESD
ncbi:chromatin DNA-binding EKC/KEOPS complex subunit gon7 [Yamadazyma tenuis]|uniref:EKC/KEOPS complex subunit GON7 n=1 Tax=Candida tenuis (strain ATCC 10573 / BCRC 21748 / CBS 615 / JCM 9827 / NBRC 10315 / NRRL Y-1498 / VKM Y-70) TaxID=590646 RepID=G3BD15_CANTC|nr:uncharacterized protein CANTEDRAFT_110464 [Yamadazyma tenuis ATCC 10573]EGV60893.1 hypothetical protein CANTEDRAFT_110464 [Yamadazyma tenuis ATCC 10573]WEJ93836.1 chromatin DNA-binding EKC/KEOPS complex subunit gon7 [Yamadazyma tenuis]